MFEVAVVTPAVTDVGWYEIQQRRIKREWEAKGQTEHRASEKQKHTPACVVKKNTKQ